MIINYINECVLSHLNISLDVHVLAFGISLNRAWIGLNIKIQSLIKAWKNSINESK